MEEIVNKILDNEETLLFVVGGSIAIIGIVFGSLCSIVKSCSKERSRREIAAYISEGTMSADQGERLMKAAEPDKLA